MILRVHLRQLVEVAGLGDGQGPDEHVEQFRTRRLEGAGPFTFVVADALVLKVREGGRCRTHYSANLMSAPPKTSWPWVKALLHSIYDQPDADAVHAQCDRVVDALHEKLPTVAEHVEDARADILAFTPFRKEIWHQIWSNSPNERLSREIRRRTDVVGIFPDRTSII